MVLRYRAWMLLAASALAGCFESDEPLIAADSVTPLAEGAPETTDVLAAPLGDGRPAFRALGED